MAELAGYLQGYIDHDTGVKRTRFAYLMLHEYVRKLLAGTLAEEEKIVILPGIRGVGKTTLLAQLYFFEKFFPRSYVHLQEALAPLNERIYIPADQLVMKGLSLHDFITYLEKNVWGDLSGNKKKILLLIDEVQYDQQWDLFLKLLFDKTKNNRNILVVATGSSAIFLNQKNKDLVRRSKTERIMPERFVEYLILHHGVFPKRGLSDALKAAIFSSGSASEVYESLRRLQPEIVAKLAEIDNLTQKKNEYFLRGTFPFSAEMEKRSAALDCIKDIVLTNIVQKDLILSGDFDAETLVKIPHVLSLLANSDEVRTKEMADTLNLHYNTINKILSSLTDAEILFEVKPYGQPYKQFKKSSKYLFVSPNIRSGLLGGVLSVAIKGKQLEDYLALIFLCCLYRSVQVFYDYGKGGADFILRFADQSEIVIEVGFGKERIDQVHNTLAKTKNRAKYGLVIGSEKLQFADEKVVKIPLDYFMLL